MKKTIRLTESDLHKIVNESVKRILREDSNPYMGMETDIMQLSEHLKGMFDVLYNMTDKSLNPDITNFANQTIQKLQPISNDINTFIGGLKQ